MVESTDTSWAKQLSEIEKSTIQSILDRMHLAYLRDLSKEAIVDFRDNSQPPEFCQLVGNALLILFGETDKEKINWPAVQKLMEDPQCFMDRLRDFPDSCLGLRPQVMDQLEPILSHPDFNLECMSKT